MDYAVQALIAAVASFVVVSLIIAAILLLCGRASKPSDPTDAAANEAPARPLRTAALLPSSSSWAYPAADDSASFDPSLDRVSMSELLAATRNFAQDGIIGDGSFGFVYKARLSSGATVAVKRLSADAFHGLREFRAEVETLGRIRHPNLVRILGFCVSGSDRVLIYEFLDRGSLDHWLHDLLDSPPPSTSASPPRLPWPTRLGIVRGVAAGLAFLHGGCRPPIVHRDIKASNVLLDAGFGARIADFGLARWVDSSRSHVSTQVAGTAGYLPPEYREGATRATPSADVYSFGILMLEVVTGRRPNLPVRAVPADGERPKEMTLALWARWMADSGRIAEIMDPLMGRKGVVEEEVKKYLGVAFMCTLDSSRDRPTMVEVVASLDHTNIGFI